VIGNTAEQVIDHVVCDVFIVKPAGFKALAKVSWRAGERRERRNAALVPTSSVSV
jgi:hypothetical protein